MKRLQTPVCRRFSDEGRSPTLPRLSENCFLLSFFPVISNEVRNLLAQSGCIQMLHSVQHDSWIDSPRFSDRISPQPVRESSSRHFFALLSWTAPPGCPRIVFRFSFLPVISNEVRNLLAPSGCIQMLHSVQHNSWIDSPRFSDRLPRK